MSVPSAPPPTYDQGQHDELVSLQYEPPSSSDGATFVPNDAQLVICPSGNATHFQKGFLGANGERAAIEGELQIKGVPLHLWESLTVTLTSSESDGKHYVELNSTSVNLYSRDGPSGSNTFVMASSIPFSIPLTPDTPQCLHTGRSSLSHVLTATLKTSDASLPVLSHSITIHTRRFTSHLSRCEVSPHSVSLNNPTPVKVELGRTTYRVDEPIPVYVTIPPPDRSVILDHGFTLRSVRAELIRTVKVQSLEGLSVNGTTANDIDEDSPSDDDDDDTDTVSSSEIPPSAEFSYAASTSTVPVSFGGPYFPNETILARSGSSCRFHTTKSVKLRLVLRSSFPSSSPDRNGAQFPEPENTFVDDDPQCASISQSSVLHTIEFRVQVRVTFLHVSTRSERIFALVLPVTILPPPAPLPEIDPSFDMAYMKKHDRPPVKTVRREDSDIYTAEHETQAGPSALAPPPFEEAPPPFFSVGEASTSRLPTFFESESEIIVPSEDHPAAENIQPLPRRESSVEGEGVLFGFPASEVYDGHSDVMRSSTPPPSLEMAAGDANVTSLAGFVNQPERAMDALNLVLEEHAEMSRSQGRDDLLPPPPPPMDDPSDPPPSIDSEFRSRNPDSDPPPSILNPDFRTTALAPRTPPPPGDSPMARVLPLSDAPAVLDVSNRRPSLPEDASGISPSHAPPPYLNPATPGETEPVSGPPPYVDLVPSVTNQSHSH
ncbi:hypothetical protein ACEPAI_947 [Sanghuangporus weigelae]